MSKIPNFHKWKECKTSLWLLYDLAVSHTGSTQVNISLMCKHMDLSFLFCLFEGVGGWVRARAKLHTCEGLKFISVAFYYALFFF